MTAADRLDEIQARADAATTGPWSHCLDELRNRTAVHRIGSSEVNTDVAFTYRDRDGCGPGMQDAEFIAHARTDVPALVATLRAVLDLHTPFRIYQASSTYEANEAEASGADPIAILCVECMSAEAEEAAEDCEWDDGVSGSVRWPCDTVRAVEAALGEVAS